MRSQVTFATNKLNTRFEVYLARRLELTIRCDGRADGRADTMQRAVQPFVGKTSQ